MVINTRIIKRPICSKFDFSCKSIRSNRLINEDRFVSKFSCLHPKAIGGCGIFGVLDGHGGLKAVEFSKNRLVDLIHEEYKSLLDQYLLGFDLRTENSPKTLSDHVQLVRRSIKSAFAKCDTELLDEISAEVDKEQKDLEKRIKDSKTGTFNSKLAAASMVDSVRSGTTVSLLIMERFKLAEASNRNHSPEEVESGGIGSGFVFGDHLGRISSPKWLKLKQKLYSPPEGKLSQKKDAYRTLITLAHLGDTKALIPTTLSSGWIEDIEPRQLELNKLPSPELVEETVNQVVEESYVNDEMDFTPNQQWSPQPLRKLHFTPVLDKTKPRQILPGLSHQLSQTHRPSSPGEKRRIERLGGWVSEDSLGSVGLFGVLGVSRLIGGWWWKRRWVEGGLAGGRNVFSASDNQEEHSKLEDANVLVKTTTKRPQGRTSVLTPQPQVSSFILPAHDTPPFILLVTDGVTSMLSNQELIDIPKYHSKPQDAISVIIDDYCENLVGGPGGSDEASSISSSRYGTNRYVDGDNCTAILIKIPSGSVGKDDTMSPRESIDWTKKLRAFKLGEEVL